jgi:hypothetical protein
MTADIPQEKIMGAILVKNTSSKPMQEIDLEDEEDIPNPMAGLPEDYVLTSLTEFVPKTITIAYDWEAITDLPLKEVIFPFIKKEREKVAGFTLSKDINLEEFEEERKEDSKENPEK